MALCGTACWPFQLQSEHVKFLESLPCRDELVAKLATQFVIALLGVPEHRSAPDSSAIF